jgi:leucyl-tRNA synthetase
MQGFYIELENGEKDETAQEEHEIFDIVWTPVKEVRDKLTSEDIKVMWDNLQNDTKVFTDKGVLINSGKFDGMDSEEAKKAITEFVSGEMTTNYRLRDWSISRQRYWGCPIPIVYSPDGEAKFVGEENLPWLLPEDVDFQPTGTAPLAKSKELKERTEKLFGKGWTPEVDTMDTFVDSSWYFLRYPETENEKEVCSAEKLKRWLPVDLYIGGAEHTYMHLLYARFFVKAMHKMGLLEFDEPFMKLRHQGMVLDQNGVKMSKSKGNVVNPNDMVERFGADATRLNMMFSGPLEEDVMWKEESVKGVYRFLEKVWRLFQEKKLIECGTGKCGDVPKEIPPLFHKTIKGVTEDIEELKFNTAISKLMIFINECLKYDNLPKSAMENFLVMLSPFAPHIAEELWQSLWESQDNVDETQTDPSIRGAGAEKYKSIFLQQWPKYNPKMIVEDKIEMVVQINGKVRDKIQVPADISEDEAKEKALASEKIKKYTDGQEIKKVIFIKGRLLNLVV